MDKPLSHSFAPMGDQPKQPPATPMAEELAKKPLSPTTPPEQSNAVPPLPVDKPKTKSDADWEEAIAKQRKEREEAKAKATADKDKPIKDKPVEQKQAPAKDTVDETKKAKAKDASSIIFTDIGSTDDFTKTFDKIEKADERSEEEKEAEPNPALIDLALCDTLGMRTKQHQLLNKLINSVDKNTKEMMKLEKCIKELGLSKIKPNIPTSDGPKVLSGDAALATVIARTKGVFRIPLYNSGFWISVKPPTLSELDAFIREVDTDFKEFGRILGAHYHLIFDLFIKQKLMELVTNNIINSNFDNFKSDDALLEVISLNDYDTIAWAFSTMMYSDGINIGVHCTNPDCAYRDNNQYVDLSKCNYLNHDVFNADASAYMLAGFTPKTIRTAKDLHHYRTNILKGSKSVKDKSGDNVYTFEVPTMRRFFDIGRELVENITQTVHGEKNTTNEMLANEITYNTYKMLTPWISKLTMLDNGTTQFITSDSKAIMESLDIGYGENSTVYEDVEQFIKDSRVCYFGVTSLKCPKCGKVPNFSRDNMLVFDMGHLFFGLSYLRLGRIGVRT